MISIIEGFVGQNGTNITKTLFTFYGSSTESKSTDGTIADGSVFVETDTKKVFMYDEKNSQWREW